MSDWGIDTNPQNVNPDNSTENLNGPAALRDAYKALKDKNSAMEQALAALQAESRQRAVTDTLTSLGIPAAAAPLYNGDADPTKVTEWANTMKSVFGSGNPAPTPTQTPTAPTLDPAVQQQFQSMNEAGTQGTPLGNVESAYASLGDAKNQDDLIKMFANLSARLT